MSDNLIADGLDAGVKHIYTQYPDGAHGIWDQSYGYAPLFSWVFAQTRQSASFAAERSNRSNAGQYLLDQNFPNPFNPSTAIRFTLQAADRISATIYNTAG